MTLRCTHAPWASLLVIQCQIICLNKVSHRCTYWIHGGQYWQWHMRPGCFSFFFPWRAWIDGRWATLVSLYCSCHSFPLCLRSPFLASTPGGCWRASLQRFFFFFFFWACTCSLLHQSESISYNLSSRYECALTSMEYNTTAQMVNHRICVQLTGCHVKEVWVWSMRPLTSLSLSNCFWLALILLLSPSVAREEWGEAVIMQWKWKSGLRPQYNCMGGFLSGA